MNLRRLERLERLETRTLNSLNSLISLKTDSDNRIKPPFDKGRFGGNVNMNGGITTTILKATKASRRKPL